MKKLILIISTVILFAGCGVGTLSVSSGKADESKLSFIDTSSYPIVVTVDDISYNVNTIKTKAYRKERKIKPTTANTIVISVGQHELQVLDETGKKVYSKKIYVSAGENKIIEL